MVAILGYSREQIFTAVRDMYTAVAEAPGGPYHFPVGRSAATALGYPPEQLAAVPEPLLASFAGVGYPFRAGAVRAGDTTLDIGAGSGHDSLIASRLVGARGRVIALDLTPAMTRKIRRTADDAGVGNVHVVEGTAERLPLADESVDSITSNGALNLVPDKRRAVAEMFRVLRPGGRLQIADVVIRRPVTVDCRADPRLWVECVVGATVDEDLLQIFSDAGFEAVETLHSHDYFALSPSAQTREIAAGFGARSVEASMRRGAHAPGWLRRWWQRLDPRRLAAAVWRRGLTGTLALGLALLACYGALAAFGLLAALGIGLAVNETVWAGTIVAFAVLAAAATAAGARFHRALGPGLLAAAGAGAVLYALLVDYRLWVELTGFAALTAAVAWDLLLRRRTESRLLGLENHAVASRRST